MAIQITTNGYNMCVVTIPWANGDMYVTPSITNLA